MSTANEPDDKPTEPRDATTPSADPAQGRGAVVPPWQRGTADTTTASGPAPRGVVSGTAANTASNTDKSAPGAVDVEKPAKPGKPGEKKFIESPTRSLEREALPNKQQLPDLDAIHNTSAAAHPAPVAEATKTAGPRSAPTQVGAGRALRASVQIRRIDPWAMFKISAVLSIVGFFIWLIAVAVLYLILDGMGVWDQINSSFGTLTTAEGSSGGGDIFGVGTIFGWAVGLGAINAVLLTALATVGAYIYNLCADLIGGAEVTLADLD